MIEQTDLEVIEWHYHEFSRPIELEEHIPNSISLDVQKKRTTQKKGIACRFSSRFIFENMTILEYTGEDSYVIDLEDVIDKNELLRMIRNSFEKYKGPLYIGGSSTDSTGKTDYTGTVTLNEKELQDWTITGGETLIRC